MEREVRECLICGVPETEHHVFEPPPPGCVCEGGDWDGADYVPIVCRNFTQQEHDADRCTTCEHNKQCHRAAPTLPESR